MQLIDGYFRFIIPNYQVDCRLFTQVTYLLVDNAVFKALHNLVYEGLFMPECEHDNDFDDLFDTDLFEIQNLPTQLNEWGVLLLKNKVII